MSVFEFQVFIKVFVKTLKLKSVDFVKFICIFSGQSFMTEFLTSTGITQYAHSKIPILTQGWTAMIFYSEIR